MRVCTSIVVVTVLSVYSRGCLLVVDEGARQGVAVARAARDGDGVFAAFLHLVDAVGAGLDRRPRQQADEPARCDADPLRRRLGGIGKLTSCLRAKGLWSGHLSFSPSSTLEKRRRTGVARPYRRSLRAHATTASRPGVNVCQRKPGVRDSGAVTSRSPQGNRAASASVHGLITRAAG